MKSEHIAWVHYGGFLFISMPADPVGGNASIEYEYFYCDFKYLK